MRRPSKKKGSKKRHVSVAVKDEGVSLSVTTEPELPTAEESEPVDERVIQDPIPISDPVLDATTPYETYKEPEEDPITLREARIERMQAKIKER